MWDELYACLIPTLQICKLQRDGKALRLMWCKDKLCLVPIGDRTNKCQSETDALCLT